MKLEKITTTTRKKLLVTRTVYVMVYVMVYVVKTRDEIYHAMSIYKAMRPMSSTHQWAERRIGKAERACSIEKVLKFHPFSDSLSGLSG